MITDSLAQLENIETLARFRLNGCLLSGNSHSLLLPNSPCNTVTAPLVRIIASNTKLEP